MDNRVIRNITTDQELEEYAAKMIIEDASNYRFNQALYSETSRKPKADKSFLANIIKHTKSYNKCMVPQKKKKAKKGFGRLFSQSLTELSKLPNKPLAKIQESQRFNQVSKQMSVETISETRSETLGSGIQNKTFGRLFSQSLSGLRSRSLSE
jgi:hypothetical protein